MSKYSMAEARKNLAELTSKVRYANERIILTKEGKDAVAIISIEALRLLEELEDRLCAIASEKSIENDDMFSEEEAKKLLGM